jgi:hypothetical protein
VLKFRAAVASRSARSRGIRARNSSASTRIFRCAASAA